MADSRRLPKGDENEEAATRLLERRLQNAQARRIQETLLKTSTSNLRPSTKARQTDYDPDHKRQHELLQHVRHDSPDAGSSESDRGIITDVDESSPNSSEADRDTQSLPSRSFTENKGAKKDADAARNNVDKQDNVKSVAQLNFLGDVIQSESGPRILASLVDMSHQPACEDTHASTTKPAISVTQDFSTEHATFVGHDAHTDETTAVGHDAYTDEATAVGHDAHTDETAAVGHDIHTDEATAVGHDAHTDEATAVGHDAHTDEATAAGQHDSTASTTSVAHVPPSELTVPSTHKSPGEDAQQSSDRQVVVIQADPQRDSEPNLHRGSALNKVLHVGRMASKAALKLVTEALHESLVGLFHLSWPFVRAGIYYLMVLFFLTIIIFGLVSVLSGLFATRLGFGQRPDIGFWDQGTAFTCALPVVHKGCRHFCSIPALYDLMPAVCAEMMPDATESMNDLFRDTYNVFGTVVGNSVAVLSAPTELVDGRRVLYELRDDYDFVRAAIDLPAEIMTQIDDHFDEAKELLDQLPNDLRQYFGSADIAAGLLLMQTRITANLIVKFQNNTLRPGEPNSVTPLGGSSFQSYINQRFVDHLTEFADYVKMLAILGESIIVKIDRLQWVLSKLRTKMNGARNETEKRKQQIRGLVGFFERVGNRIMFTEPPAIRPYTNAIHIVDNINNHISTLSRIFTPMWKGVSQAQTSLQKLLVHARKESYFVKSGVTDSGGLLRLLDILRVDAQVVQDSVDNMNLARNNKTSKKIDLLAIDSKEDSGGANND